MYLKNKTRLDETLEMKNEKTINDNGNARTETQVSRLYPFQSGRSRAARLNIYGRLAMDSHDTKIHARSQERKN